MAQIITLGETLYDLIFREGVPIAGKAGGSVLNASITLGKLGCKTSFVSELGNDDLGKLILDFLESNGVESKYISLSEENTSLAIAMLNDEDDAKYTFYKKSGAMQLQKNIVWEANNYFLFGSYLAIDGSNANSVKEILHDAKNNHTLILYDPNFRRSFYNISSWKNRIDENIATSDIVRASDKDMQHVCAARNYAVAYSYIRRAGCEILIYTSGNSGMWLCTPEITKFYKIPEIETVSTIGAGDTVNAGILHALYNQNIQVNQVLQLSETFWDALIENCVKMAADVCMSYDNYISDELTKEMG